MKPETLEKFNAFLRDGGRVSIGGNPIHGGYDVSAHRRILHGYGDFPRATRGPEEPGTSGDSATEISGEAHGSKDLDASILAAIAACTRAMEEWPRR